MKSEVYTGGLVWQKAIEQFQALYLEVGSLNFAIDLAPDIVTAWPMHDEKKEPVIPDFSVMRRWAFAVDDGKAKVNEKTQSRIHQKLDRYLLSETAHTIRALQQASRHLAAQVKDGKFRPDMNGTLGNLNSGWTFGLKALIEAKGGTAAARGAGMNVGNLQIVFPDKKKLQQLQQPKRLNAGQFKPKEIIEGEVVSRG